MKPWQKQLTSWANKPFIKQLKRTFPRAEVFLVGGAVRDAILGRDTQDVDLVIRQLPKPSLEKFLKKYGAVSLVGKRFGVFKFKAKGTSTYDIDIALPRTEHTINNTGAYKDFKISSNAKLSIIDDLSRRDFTVNAMAWDVYGEKLIDPFDGLADCNQKIIRTVGKPEQRFAEDYSRLLRALRFAIQLNFSIAPATFLVIKKQIKNLEKKVTGQRVVPEEVIAKELIKLLHADPMAGLTLLDKAGAVALLMPELLKMKRCPQPKQWHAEGDVWVHTLLTLKQLTTSSFKKEFDNPTITDELIWALIFHDVGKPYTLTKTDRIRFNGHDAVSTEKFLAAANRLKLSAAGLDVEAVANAIAKHMLLANSGATKMKETTVEKYFFSDRFPGQLLLMTMFADVAATLPASGKANFTSYRQLAQRISRLAKKSKGKKILPKPLLNGTAIMRSLNIKSGPQVGQLISLLREAQLSGKVKSKQQALAFLKKKL